MLKMFIRIPKDTIIPDIYYTIHYTERSYLERGKVNGRLYLATLKKASFWCHYKGAFKYQLTLDRGRGLKNFVSIVLARGGGVWQKCQLTKC